jgi:hypothetical protein
LQPCSFSLFSCFTLSLHFFSLSSVVMAAIAYYPWQLTLFYISLYFLLLLCCTYCAALLVPIYKQEWYH